MLYGPVESSTASVLSCCMDQWSLALPQCCHAVWTSGVKHCLSVAMLYGPVESSTASVLPWCMDQWSPALPQCYHAVWTSGVQHCLSVAMLYGPVESSTASVLPWCMDQWSQALPQCCHAVWTSGVQQCLSVAMLYGPVESSTPVVLLRYMATEILWSWYGNALSSLHSSSVLLSKSLRKIMAFLPNTSEVSIPNGSQWWVHLVFAYLCMEFHWLSSVSNCTRFTGQELRIWWGKVSRQVVSQTRTFPDCHGIRVAPSGCFPSSQSKPGCFSSSRSKPGCFPS